MIHVVYHWGLLGLIAGFRLEGSRVKGAIHPAMILVCHKVCGPKAPHKQKDPTSVGQNVGSSCSCVVYGAPKVSKVRCFEMCFMWGNGPPAPLPGSPNTCLLGSLLGFWTRYPVERPLCPQQYVGLKYH